MSADHPLIAAIRAELAAAGFADRAAGLLALEMAENVVGAEKTSERNAAAASLARLLAALGILAAATDDEADPLTQHLRAGDGG